MLVVWIFDPSACPLYRSDHRSGLRSLVAAFCDEACLGGTELKMAWGCQAGIEPVILTTIQNQSAPNSTKPHTTIKLGIDAHAKWYYVARQIDGTTPQPVQKMTFDGPLHFPAKQQRIAQEVFTCYESSGARSTAAKAARGGPVNPERLDSTRGDLKAFSIVRECPSLQWMGRRLRKLRASCSVLMMQFFPMHP